MHIQNNREECGQMMIYPHVLSQIIQTHNTAHLCSKESIFCY